MTENEKELLMLIRKSENPEKALKVAMDLAIDFLKKREALQCTSSEHPPEFA